MKLRDRRENYLEDIRKHGLADVLCLLSILCDELAEENIEEADCWLHRNNILKNVAELCLYPNELSTYATK